MLERLQHIDQTLTLWINDLGTPKLDQLWLLFSDVKVWFLAYLLIGAYVIHRLGWKRGLIIIVSAALAILLVDQTANLVKNSVCRLRPCYSSYMLENGLHWSEGRGGFFGFYSGHAANSFALATTVAMALSLVKKNGFDRGLIAGFYTWAALVSISRIMAGKHYLGDVLAGALAGTLLAVAVALIARLIIKAVAGPSPS
ncbi:MAG: phosphatase PAP2 family protein [Bacteroidales bacterium]|nr:phosphatase PAP2 family protein [Bacteroidales bacterium]